MSDGKVIDLEKVRSERVRASPCISCGYVMPKLEAMLEPVRIQPESWSDVTRALDAVKINIFCPCGVTSWRSDLGISIRLKSKS